MELARWRDHLGLAEMRIEPKFFPVAADLAARVIVAQNQAGGDASALALANAIGGAVWEREMDISTPDTLDQLAGELSLDGTALLAAAESQAAGVEYQANNEAAITDQVFGVPWLILDGIPYWGQDRYDFVQAALLAWGELNLVRIAELPLPGSGRHGGPSAGG